MESYLVSLLKAYWGDAARQDNDFCFDYLPRITGSHSTYGTVQEQLAGRCKGYFLLGENPAVGLANARMQRLGLAQLDWLVVRDFSLIESATFWKDGPEVELGETRPEDIGTEVFFFPAAAHTEKEGTFTNTNRLLQWHHKAVEPVADQRRTCGSCTTWACWCGIGCAPAPTRWTDRSSTSLGRTRPAARMPSRTPRRCCARSTATASTDGLSAVHRTEGRRQHGCGCWIYCGVFANGENQSQRRRDHRDQNWLGPQWGWAWPANRRVLYNRASADLDGRPWSDRKALVWWDEEQRKWTGHDVPDFVLDKRPDYQPPPNGSGPEGLSGTEPFIMQADGRGWLFAPSGVTDGPLPTHYEPRGVPGR